MKKMYIAWASLALLAVAWFPGRIVYSPWWVQTAIFLAHFLGIVYGSRQTK